MEGLAVSDIQYAAGRIMRRLYFNAGSAGTLICEFHASLTKLEQRCASFSRKCIWSDPLLKADNIASGTSNAACPSRQSSRTSP